MLPAAATAALAAALLSATAAVAYAQQDGLPAERPALLDKPAASPVQEPEHADPLGLDWLSAQRGRFRFADGLITVNPDELQRFRVTGRVPNFLRFGPVVVEVRSGTFLSTSDDPDDSIDTPASVLVTFKGRRMAAAKGYRLGADVVKNGVEISHWNGEEGCSVKTWRLQFIGERMAIDAVTQRSQEDGEPCTADPDANGSG